MSFGLFGALFIALLGARLIAEGLRGERTDRIRALGLQPWVMVLGGILCEVPLAINLYALWLQRSLP
jgi:hypothetical protein